MAYPPRKRDLEMHMYHGHL